MKTPFEVFLDEIYETMQTELCQENADNYDHFQKDLQKVSIETLKLLVNALNIPGSALLTKDELISCLQEKIETQQELY